MIDYIKGILITKKPTSAVVESNGIGYFVNITIPAFESCGKPGDEVKFVTHLHVKDNPFSVTLYGFSDEGERECFRQIISVSGIGPKTALSILSAINYRELVDLILKGNYMPLTSVSGVGRKTAERLALELKDKLYKTSAGNSSSAFDAGKFGELSKEGEIVSALLTLGYNRIEADKMLKAVSGKNGFTDMSPEDIIKEILRGK
ncbi:MAG: Holliday junction branch migration protein RuvA [Chlorobi bacterium]|nr:Holliday junction branch migration protein RuvA [Chlorobiota bacterium]